MDYYTGPVFEAGLEGVPYSIGGGGRYDGLIGKFAGRELPAVGFSIGFERILAILLERTTQAASGPAPRVFLINQGQGEAEIHRSAEKLRESGVAVETYFLDADFGRQMKMAEALGIGYAIKEFRPLEGTYLVRKLSERKDISVTLEGLKELLEG
jgi:histidyl-tRNA synthetase